VVRGPWSVVRGPWSVVRGPWSVVIKFEPQISLIQQYDSTISYRIYQQQMDSRPELLSKS